MIEACTGQRTILGSLLLWRPGGQRGQGAHPAYKSTSADKVPCWANNLFGFLFPGNCPCAGSAMLGKLQQSQYILLYTFIFSGFTCLSLTSS